eukprot:scaffold63596_cov65-Phaeocystis_antarctica.AAC.1
MVAGLRHAERRFELPWLRASTTMVAGLQQAAPPRAPAAAGLRHYGCRPTAHSAQPRAPG